MSSNPADLLPRARIRLAALELFGRQGFDQTTLRQLAARAGVSPGLVIHHFGSKKELRQACDAYALQLFSDERVYLSVSGPMPSLRSFLDDHPDLEPVLAYLVQALRGGDEIAQEVYDLFCSSADDMFAEAERTGLMVLPDDREAAIALLSTWSAGLLLLGDLFARRLGGEHLTDPGVMTRYASVSTELFSRGVLAESYVDLLRSDVIPDEGPLQNPEQPRE